MDKENSYIKYDYLYLDDGTVNQEITSEPKSCLVKCQNNPDCKGLDIISSKSNPNVKCKYINNICYSNFKKLDSKSNFYKKSNDVELENLIPYNATIAGKNLYVKDNDILTVSDTESTPWVYDTDNLNLKVSNKDLCMVIKDDKVDVTKCNTYSPEQKIVYENIYSTLRPKSKLYNCISLNNSNDKLVILPCGKSLKNEIIFDTYYNNMDNQENFSADVGNDKDYTLNLTYYTIYMIMLIMILFLVLVITKN